ncbi:serine hydrolase domain-containing protein [Bacillus weihaiensis]|uniref:Penicillin-binding protein n=1 Tax=Bacillus weihaiensis TaxID=1547283 RepID=A0A1L3MRF1_9BACI|nr:serine hydrolase domain-containing protein [Bacillus weihaiensis]APH04945.1 penicillin-binding protein [Bacillus weihaiensis]
MNLQLYVDMIKEKNNSSASAIYILKDNKVVYEYYNGYHSNTADSLPITSASQFNVASVRKSYLGLVLAYALYEGKIKSLDEYVYPYFDDLDKKLLGKTTIRHLVTHSHGLNTKENGEMFREFEPGEKWAYRGINVLLITRLVHYLYKKPFPEFLKEKVFSPLGLNETGWYSHENERLVKVITDPSKEGTFHIGNSSCGTEANLHVSARDLAQWGNLHLNRGLYHGKRIVPKDVIDMATTIQSPKLTNSQIPKHGLFWYVQGATSIYSELGDRVPKGSYQIIGVTGPTLLVIPTYKIVVAKMYNKRFNYGGENYLFYLREFSNLVADTFK